MVFYWCYHVLTVQIVTTSRANGQIKVLRQVTMTNVLIFKNTNLYIICYTVCIYYFSSLATDISILKSGCFHLCYLPSLRHLHHVFVCKPVRKYLFDGHFCCSYLSSHWQDGWLGSLSVKVHIYSALISDLHYICYY